jgi:hypothetical protein
MCAITTDTTCTGQEPPPAFSDDQAEHLVWHYVRAIADGISGMMWYTLNYHSYRHVGLLNADNSNKPAYIAYQFLVSHDDAHRTLEQYFTLRA